MSANLKSNYISFKKEFESYCKERKSSAKLLAVSKTKPLADIYSLLEEGQTLFGENYAQELEEKSSLINSSEIIWHFIGPIQSNKVKVIASCADWVHTLDRKKVVVKLNNECKKENKVINACIQVNISNEESKNGCHPEDLLNLSKLVESMENINLKGIMALPKLTNNKNEREHMMQSVKKLSTELQSVHPRATYVSLGTTSDFYDAIINGANMVRIGESIFGKRL